MMIACSIYHITVCVKTGMLVVNEASLGGWENELLAELAGCRSAYEPLYTSAGHSLMPED